MKKWIVLIIILMSCLDVFCQGTITDTIRQKEKDSWETYLELANDPDSMLHCDSLAIINSKLLPALDTAIYYASLCPFFGLDSNLYFAIAVGRDSTIMIAPIMSAVSPFDKVLNYRWPFYGVFLYKGYLFVINGTKKHPVLSTILKSLFNKTGKIVDISKERKRYLITKDDAYLKPSWAKYSYNNGELKLDEIISCD